MEKKRKRKRWQGYTKHLVIPSQHSSVGFSDAEQIKLWKFQVTAPVRFSG